MEARFAAALSQPEWDSDGSDDEVVAPPPQSSSLVIKKKTNPNASVRGDGPKSQKRRKKDNAPPAPNECRVLYFGHLPRNFAERELRGFLTQFGTVKRIKIARSRRTGAPCGYGHVEFADAEVCRIVAEALHGHVLVDRRLVCHVVPPERCTPADRRRIFSQPGNLTKSYADKREDAAMEQRLKVLKRAKAVTTAMIERSGGRRMRKYTERKDKLASMGIEYAMPMPEVLIPCSMRGKEKAKEDENVKSTKKDIKDVSLNPETGSGTSMESSPANKKGKRVSSVVSDQTPAQGAQLELSSKKKKGVNSSKKQKGGAERDRKGDNAVSDSSSATGKKNNDVNAATVTTSEKKRKLSEDMASSDVSTEIKTPIEKKSAKKKKKSEKKKKSTSSIDAVVDTNVAAAELAIEKELKEAVEPKSVKKKSMDAAIIGTPKTKTNPIEKTTTKKKKQAKLEKKKDAAEQATAEVLMTNTVAGVDTKTPAPASVNKQEVSTEPKTTAANSKDEAISYVAMTTPDYKEASRSKKEKLKSEKKANADAVSGQMTSIDSSTRKMTPAEKITSEKKKQMKTEKKKTQSKGENATYSKTSMADATSNADASISATASESKQGAVMLKAKTKKSEDKASSNVGLITQASKEAKSSSKKKAKSRTKKISETKLQPTIVPVTSQPDDPVTYKNTTTPLSGKKSAKKKKKNTEEQKKVGMTLPSVSPSDRMDDVAVAPSTPLDEGCVKKQKKSNKKQKGTTEKVVVVTDATTSNVPIAASVAATVTTAVSTPKATKDKHASASPATSGGLSKTEKKARKKKKKRRLSE